jgi:phosphoribosyl-AMP cyclohydrolase
MMLSEEAIGALRWDNQGLIAAIVQDAHSHHVLMLAYVNRDALRQMLQIGETVFWSRSRQALWHKGETSGNTQRVVEIRVDCDADALLVMVEPAGPACHTGHDECFYRSLSEFDNDPVRE